MEKSIYTFRDLQKIETVLKGEFGEVWLFDKTPGNCLFKCYSENISLMRKILSWAGTKQGATYIRSDQVMITFDVIIPKRLVKRACKLLGVQLIKDSRKIEAGKRLDGKRNSFLSGNSRNNFIHICA
jgi:hypothetical protein